jgi:O-antigen/teichoic acid export membrane protein
MATTLLQAAAMFRAARREYPDLPFRPSAPLGPVARSLIGYGAASLLLQGAVRVAFHTDNIVIAAFLTKSAVATFAIAGTLIAYLRQVVGAMTNVLTPTAAEMDARGDLPGLRALFERGTTLCLALAIPVLATFLLDRGIFVRLWVGPSFGASAPILRVLALGQLAALPQLAAGVILYGMNRHMRNAVIAVAEALANLALSIVLVRAIGLIGVAWGTTIPLLVTQTIVLPRYVCSLLRMSPWGLFARCYLPAAGAGVVYAAAFRGAIRAVAPEGLLSYFACVAVALVPYALIVFRFVIDGATRRALLAGWRGSQGAQ